MVPLGGIAHPLPVRHRSGEAWTVERYRAMPDDGRRYELIDGTLYQTPSPRLPHQDTLREMLVWLSTRLGDERPAPRVMCAPFDVYLGEDIVVQPDLLVLLPDRLHLLADDGVHGAPSLVVEISSPGTATYDRHDKLLAYAQAGVPEYWLADPLAKSLEILVLHDRRYRTHALITGPADVPSVVLGQRVGPVGRFFGG
jgi:Uma2 family endonuclease